MTTSSTSLDDALRPVPLHSTYVVGAAHGPLVGEGRLRRGAPFAITSCLSVIIGVPATKWPHPAFAVGGTAAVAIMLTIGMLIPWERLSRRAQLIPPVLLLTATMLLMAGDASGLSSPFMAMAVLPLAWLALYESRWAVVAIGALTGAALWLVVSLSNGAPSDANVTIIVFVICVLGMGITLQGFVADSRRVAGALHDQGTKLENAALMLDAIPDPVSLFRVADHVITYCNVAWADLYHCTPSDAIGRRLESFLSDDEMAGLTAQLARLGPADPILEDVAPRAVQVEPVRWLHWIDRYIAGEHGDEVLSIGRDVTAGHTAEAALAASEARYRELADNSADVVWRFAVEPTPHLDYISPSVERLLGYPRSYFLDDFTSMLDVLDEASADAIRRAVVDKQALEDRDFHFRHADGSIVIGETRTALVSGGLQGVSRDVTELRRLQGEVAELALTDPLTGLANRRFLEQILDGELERTRRQGSMLAVAFLDIDGLKCVNDTYGHEYGDVVICETADRLREVVRNSDTVARVGGDEFVIVYEPADSNPQHLVERVRRALSVPITLTPTVTVTCPASIGVAETATVGYDKTALLAEADRSMYGRKRAKSNA